MVVTPSRIDLQAQAIQELHPTLGMALRGHRTHKGTLLDLKSNPAMLTLYGDQSKEIWVMKSTQNGVSEWLLVTVFTECSAGRNVFYVLPTIQLAGRFVRERFDKTIVYTKHYGKLIATGGRTDNVGMKQIGPGTAVFVGSNAPASFTEFAADVAIIDEYVRCDQVNILMTDERLSASTYRRKINISQPMLEGDAFDSGFSSTDQLHWAIKCDCGKFIEPDFFRHILRQEDENLWVVSDTDFDPTGPGDARLVCHRCGRKIDRRGLGRWQAHGVPGKRGYHFSKLFTTHVEIRELIEKFSKAEGNDDLMARFYNADLGLPYNSPGAKLSVAALNEALGQHHTGEIPDGGVAVAGIDVGATFNIIIGHLKYGEPGVRVLDILEVRDPEQVLDALVKYGVRSFVIDGMPEMRLSRTIVARHPGGFVCFFTKGKGDVVTHRRISTDRTATLDNVKAAVMTRGLSLPANAPSVPGFYDQMIASTRVYDPDANGGEGGYFWVEGSKADHYFLATGYCLIAARLIQMAQR
jgi:hypothetical protein